MGTTIGPASIPSTPTPATPGVVQNPLGEEILPLEELVRHTEAVDLLYRIHRDAGRVLARSLSSNERDAEAVVQVAVTQTIKTIDPGEEAPRYFAAELNTAIRGIAASWHETGGHGLLPAAPSRGLSAPPGPALPAPGGMVLEGFPGYVVLQEVLTAMQTLPGSWQEVLWCADVLGEDLGDIAAWMGVTSEAVEFLIVRAHAGLRKAYRELH